MIYFKFHELFLKHPSIHLPFETGSQYIAHIGLKLEILIAEI